NIDSKILSMAGSSLSRLFYGAPLTREPLDTVTTYCKNITTIFIVCSSTGVCQFIGSSISTLEKLKRLEIECNCYDVTNIILQSLENKLPLSLVYLRFISFELIAPSALNKFLEKCDAPLETLIISLDWQKYSFEYGYAIIKFYDRMHTLKRLETGTYMDKLVFVAIESCGVKISEIDKFKSLRYYF
ncbi:18344_t:CDS:1, partial [Acaulospora morrowiae]